MPDIVMQIISMGGRLLLAAALGVLIAYRRDSDRHHLSILHSHAFLAVAGALFIVIIGDQFERAIALIGVATIIRYRYAIRNPKDAGTLIISLGLGMACGAEGLVGVAVVAALFVMLISRLLDLLPTIMPGKLFRTHNETRLRVTTSNPEATIERLESVLRSAGIGYSLTSVERKRLEMRDVTLIEAQLRFGGDLEISRLTADISDESVVSIAWRQTEPSDYWG